MTPPDVAESGRCHLVLLDVPVVLIADDPALLATAASAYADWTVEAPAAGSALELRLALRDASTEEVSAAIRVEGSQLTLAGGGIDGVADADLGRARCDVPRRFVGDAAALAAEVTDTLLLFLLTRTGGRAPLHAAGVMIGGTAMVLAGPSGAGKSTLALSAVRRGLAVLSEDTVYVQTVPALRVWGFARPIHVLAAEAPPEVREFRLRGGRRKAVVPLPGGATGTRWADRARLVLLSRGERLAMTPVDREVAVASLARLDEGFDLLAEQSAAAVRALAEAGAWRLTLTSDPGGAIDLLCRWAGG